MAVVVGVVVGGDDFFVDGAGKGTQKRTCKYCKAT